MIFLKQSSFPGRFKAPVTVKGLNSTLGLTMQRIATGSSVSGNVNEEVSINVSFFPSCL